MSRRLLLLSLCLALGAPVTVSGLKVDNRRSADVDFATLETFAFAARSDKKLPKPGSPFDEKVRETLIDELAKKRLRLVEEGEEPDLLLTYEGFLGLEGELPQDTYTYVRWVDLFEGPGGSAPQVPRPMGFLTVELRHPGSNEILWAGWGSDKAKNQLAFIDKIEKMIRKIIRYYPSPK